MNYEEANAVKDLAKPLIKVLEKVGKTKCEHCAGTGLLCYKCGGTGKVKWKWQPKVGERCIYKNKILLITSFRKEVLEGEVLFGNISTIIAKESIPILHWEEIERIIKKAGFRIDICVCRDGYECMIIAGGSKKMANVFANSHQEAVMLGVMKLGEKMK